MSTPIFIGVLCKEGIIKFVYCHSDSYPSYLGKMLLEHYNTPELATALVDLGSLSMVRERLAPDEGEMHGFDTPVRHGPKGGVTTAYHRDRGEDLEIDSIVVDTPVVLKNAETLFLNILKEENITYGYLYNVADTECLNLAKSIDAIMLCYNPDIDALKAENLSDMAVRLLDGVSRRDVVKDLEDFRDKWRHYNEQAAAESQVILDKISELFEKDGNSN